MSPIRPSQRERYPEEWQEISARIRFDRAGGRCECLGECGSKSNQMASKHCIAEHGLPHPVTGKLVILTVAHLNHTPEDNRDENLRAMCQGCHLNYDKEHHAETRRQTRLRASDNIDLFSGSM